MIAISVAGLRAYCDTVRPQIKKMVVDITTDLLKRIPFESNDDFMTHLKSVIWTVLSDGSHTAHYYSPQNCGFETRDLFNAAMQKLKEVWKTDIDMDFEGNAITYKVHNPAPNDRPQSVLFAQFVRGDNVWFGEFDDDLFMFPLMAAARNGKDPVAALGLLADEACRANVHLDPAVKRAIGE